MREVSASPLGGTDGGQRVSGLRARPAWVDEMLAAPAAVAGEAAAADSHHGHHDHHEHGGGECGACAPEAPCAEHAAEPAAAAGWHDGGVGTVSLRAAGPLDLARLRAWLDGLLWERDAAGGADVLRLKGVLHVDRSPRMHLLQAVYETYDVVEGPAWGESTGGGGGAAAPLSRLVVIGRRLRRAALQAALDACVAPGGGGGE